jgi:hypothetical protein
VVKSPAVVGWHAQTTAGGAGDRAEGEEAVGDGGGKRSGEVWSPVGPVDAAVNKDPPGRSDLIRVDAQVGDQLPAPNGQDWSRSSMSTGA